MEKNHGTALAAVQNCSRELVDEGYAYKDIADALFSAAAGILAVVTGREQAVAELVTVWAVLGFAADVEEAADGSQ